MRLLAAVKLGDWAWWCCWLQFHPSPVFIVQTMGVGGDRLTDRSAVLIAR